MQIWLKILIVSREFIIITFYHIKMITALIKKKSKSMNYLILITATTKFRRFYYTNTEKLLNK
jgi:hypothetical protein